MLMKVDFEYSKRHMFGSPNRSGKSLSDYEYRDGISHNGITCLDRSFEILILEPLMVSLSVRGHNRTLIVSIN